MEYNPRIQHLFVDYKGGGGGQSKSIEAARMLLLLADYLLTINNVLTIESSPRGDAVRL